MYLQNMSNPSTRTQSNFAKKNTFQAFQVTIPIPIAKKQADLLPADHGRKRGFSEPSLQQRHKDLTKLGCTRVKIDSHGFNSVVTHASS